MASSVRRKIVGLEMFIAVTSTFSGIMIGTAAAAMKLPPSSDSFPGIISWTTAFAAEWWWVGVVVALTTAVLGAASDRSRAGMWAMITIGAVGIVALVWTGVADILPIGIWSIVVIGMAAGMATNRVLFGVVRPIPEARRRREQTDWHDYF